MPANELTRVPLVGSVWAVRWWKAGDHPEDDRKTFCVPGGVPFLGEGRVVRYFRHPGVPSDRMCPRCGHDMHVHGWLDNDRNGQVVCPGDWIVHLGPRGQPVVMQNRTAQELFLEIPDQTPGLPDPFDQPKSLDEVSRG